QVISRARRVFEVELPLRLIFEGPTVAELARCVVEARRDGFGLTSTPITRVERSDNLRLSFAQQRLWFLDQLGDVYALPAMMQLKGALIVEALETTITEVVRRHAVLRTSFVPVDGVPTQVISPPRPVPLLRIDLTQYSPTERDVELRRLIESELQRSFSLSEGVLFHTSLVQLDEHDH